MLHRPCYCWWEPIDVPPPTPAARTCLTFTKTWLLGAEKRVWTVFKVAVPKIHWPGASASVRCLVPGVRFYHHVALWSLFKRYVGRFRFKITGSWLGLSRGVTVSHKPNGDNAVSCTQMLRKFCIVGLATSFGRGTTHQAFFTGFICIGWMGVQIRIQPYFFWEDNMCVYYVPAGRTLDSPKTHPGGTRAIHPLKASRERNVCAQAQMCVGLCDHGDCPGHPG